MGMVPFGSLMSGWLAARIGADNTLLFGGICCIIAAAVYSFMLPAVRKEIRPIYAEKGIMMPEDILR
jgi:MFS-type transporter involved in bile tolerance (Atg22 family)